MQLYPTQSTKKPRDKQIHSNKGLKPRSFVKWLPKINLLKMHKDLALVLFYILEPLKWHLELIGTIDRVALSSLLVFLFCYALYEAPKFLATRLLFAHSKCNCIHINHQSDWSIKYSDMVRTVTISTKSH